MHRQKFGEFFIRTIPLELIEGPQKTTFFSLAVLLEPNAYNMMDIDVVWKRKANTGYLADWKFDHQDYMIKGKTRRALLMFRLNTFRLKST